MVKLTKIINLLLVLICLVSLVSFSGACNKIQRNNRFIELLSMLPASAKNAGGFVLIDYEEYFKENGISLHTPDGKKITLDDLEKIIGTKISENQTYALAPLGLGSY